MSAHTKEPWGISHDSHDGWPLVMAGGKIIANVNLESFNAGVADLIEMPAEANARRIVACVNACAGIPTDMLEAMPSGPASLLPMYARLEQQRDELVAALDRTEKCLRIAANHGCSAETLLDVANNAKGVLAKVGAGDTAKEPA